MLRRKILAVAIAGSMLSAGFATVATSAATAVTNTTLLANYTATTSWDTVSKPGLSEVNMKAISNPENQSITIENANGKALNNVSASIIKDGKVIFTGEVQDGQLSLASYYNFGQLQANLNEGNNTVTLKVKGYAEQNINIYVNKLYCVCMAPLTNSLDQVMSNYKFNVNINGKTKSVETDSNGYLYVFSGENFNLTPTNSNSLFGQVYSESQWQFTTSTYYNIEANTVKLHSATSQVQQVSTLPSQSLTLKTKDGSLINNKNVTIVENGKTIFTGTTSNGKVLLAGPYIFGNLINGLKTGTNKCTITVEGYGSKTININVEKYYAMAAMGLGNASNGATLSNYTVHAVVNGQDRTFTTDSQGNLYLVSNKNFTFAPENYNSLFGQTYQSLAWEFSVSPYYVITNNDITM